MVVWRVCPAQLPCGSSSAAIKVRRWGMSGSVSQSKVRSTRHPPNCARIDRRSSRTGSEFSRAESPAGSRSRPGPRLVPSRNEAGFYGVVAFDRADRIVQWTADRPGSF